jgi:hypothetical protein
MDLLTTYTRQGELQVITALLLISSLYKSLHVKSSPGCNVSNNRSLATASSNEDSWALHSQVLSSQPLVQNSALNSYFNYYFDLIFPSSTDLHININCHLQSHSTFQPALLNRLKIASFFHRTRAILDKVKTLGTSYNPHSHTEETAAIEWNLVNG